MSGRPTVQVLLDDGTGTFPHDVTAFVLQNDGHKFNRGRDDEQSAPTVGILNLVFNNTGGEFSPGSTGLDTPSPIVVDQQIRLKETVNGTLYTRYTGYVKSWRVGFAGGGAYSVVRVTASNVQARGERRPLRSVIEEEILSDSPAAYYILGEPAGATSAADSSGNQEPALTMAGVGTAVVFGTATGPDTDGLTAATFATGQYLQNATYSYGSTPAFIVAFTTTSAALQGIISPLGMNAGTLRVLSTNVGSGTYNDGLVHVVAIRYTAASTADVYVDGVLTDTGVTATDFTGVLGLLVGFNGIGSTLDGSVAHVAVFNIAPTGARLISESQAMLTGFADESGTDRITRLAGYAGIPLGTLDTSLTDVPSKDFSGTSAWSAIQDVVDAEGGLGIIDASGELVFVNRNDAPLKTAPDITIAAAFVTRGVEPTDDDAEIINYFEGTAESTGVAQLVRDVVSEEAHGRYPESKTYLVTTDQEALARANWVVGVNAEPATRYPSLTINLLNMTAAQQEAAIGAIEPGAWLRVTGMNTQTPGGTTVDVMVQGFTETLTDNEWSLTCNVVARAKFETAIYADATYGIYGESRYYY